MRNFLLSLLCFGLVIFIFGCSYSESDEEQVTTRTPTMNQEEKTADKTDNKSDVTSKSVKEISVKATDITGHPCEREIKELLKLGAVELDKQGQFKPDEMIKRGEFIMWLYKMDSKGVKPLRPSKPSYSDLQPNNAYYEEIEGLTAAGLLKGFSDGTIKLDKELSRQEAAYIWGVYVQNPVVVNEEVKAPYETVISHYKDCKEVTADNLRSVVVFRDQWKDVFGHVPKLRPNQSVTRAEAAQWIILCYKK